jgi:hypothetical protein
MQWQLNASTGCHLLNVISNGRVIRQRHGQSYLYRADYWGDYSLDFPVAGVWRGSLGEAKRDLSRLAGP